MQCSVPILFVSAIIRFYFVQIHQKKIEFGSLSGWLHRIADGRDLRLKVSIGTTVDRSHICTVASTYVCCKINAELFAALALIIH